MGAYQPGHHRAFADSAARAGSVGLDPIHFGIIMAVNLAIGFITPLLGINLFVASRVGQTSLETLTSGIISFILVMLVCLAFVTFIPQLSLLLPRLPM